MGGEWSALPEGRSECSIRFGSTGKGSSAMG
jgi:hypothetical protein